MPAARDDGVRLLLPLMRASLLLGAFLVSLAGIQLYFLTTRTADYFAWTISVPVTAAFLGAFYWTSLPLAAMSARQGVWANARVGVPGVLVFLWATLATTLLHLDKFHFDRADDVARGAAWLWLAIYAADPVLVSMALVMQVRQPGTDPVRADRLPAWYRTSAAVQSSVVLFAGAAMMVSPTWVASWWLWPLTPLTARAMGSWLLGLGVVLATAVAEDDWVRIRVATAAYSVLGLLQIGALMRHGGDLTADAPLVALYVGFVGWISVLGIYGLWRSSGPRTRLADPGA